MMGSSYLFCRYYVTLGLLSYVLCKCSIKLNMKSSGLFWDFRNIKKKLLSIAVEWITSKLHIKKKAKQQKLKIDLNIWEFYVPVHVRMPTVLGFVDSFPFGKPLFLWV